MITIFPIHEDEAIKSAKKRLDGTVDVILQAKDGDEELGLIGFTLSKDSINITALSVVQPFIVDGLIKSALSYAIQRELPIVTASAKGFDRQFMAVGFTENNGTLFLRLDTFTSKCTCKTAALE